MKSLVWRHGRFFGFAWAGVFSAALVCGQAWAQQDVPAEQEEATPDGSSDEGPSDDRSSDNGPVAGEGEAAEPDDAENADAPAAPRSGPATPEEHRAQADLDVVLAFERVIARAIERAERSVVSIARDHQGAADNISTRDFRPDPFGFRQPVKEPPKPTDPDFVPNEFATGIVLDWRGLILTNYHVIDENSEHYVTTSDRKVFRTVIKAADPRSDLAVLEVIDRFQDGDFVPMPLGDASQLHKGQIVISLGNPYAIARDGQVSASWGIVSNLSRKAGAAPRMSEDSKVMLHHFGTLIQTDAKLNLGTSGGALINLRGEMVGLTTSLAATAGYEQSAGYAIPVDETFLRVIKVLKKGEEVEYGFLGIEPSNLMPEEVRAGLTGMRVLRVKPGTPARRHGIETGDIITHVDGLPIHDADGLRLNVGKLAAAAVTTLTVVRDGQTLQRQVALAKYPVEGKKIVTQRPAAWRGMRVDYVTAVSVEYLDDFHGSSLAVSEVDENSPAWRAGLRRGTLITHVGNTPVDDPADFRRIVESRRDIVKLKAQTPRGSTETITVEAQ